MGNSGHDPVNHPSHYTFGTIKVLDAIEDWELDYHRGQAVKYIARAGRKVLKPHDSRDSAAVAEAEREAELEDLRKAVFYLNRKIAQLDG